MTHQNMLSKIILADAMSWRLQGHLQRTNMGASAVIEKDILMACDSPCIIRLYNTSAHSAERCAILSPF